MTKEIENTFSIITKLFDTNFRIGCPFYWPFSLEMAEYVFQDASYCENLEQILGIWESVARQKIDEKKDWFNEDNEFEDKELEYLEDILNQIRKSKVFTWTYGQIICSAIFFVFHKKVCSDRFSFMV